MPAGSAAASLKPDAADLATSQKLFGGTAASQNRRKRRRGALLSEIGFVGQSGTAFRAASNQLNRAVWTKSVCGCPSCPFWTTAALSIVRRDVTTAVRSADKPL
jgi:hypothetical protein